MYSIDRTNPEKQLQSKHGFHCPYPTSGRSHTKAKHIIPFNGPQKTTSSNNIPSLVNRQTHPVNRPRLVRRQEHHRLRNLKRRDIRRRLGRLGVEGMDGLNLRVRLGVELLVPSVAGGNGLADARVDGTREHCVASDAFLAEAPCHILGGADLPSQGCQRYSVYPRSLPPRRLPSELNRLIRKQKKENEPDRACCTYTLSQPRPPKRRPCWRR